MARMPIWPLVIERCGDHALLRVPNARRRPLDGARYATGAISGPYATLGGGHG